MNLNPFNSPNYKNPADSAMPYLQQVPGTVSPYYQPYINAGNESLNSLMGQYSQLLNSPQSIMNSIGAGYQQSPAYQFQYNQGMNAANAAAAAGGTLGTGTHQMNAASMGQNLANTDFYNYLSRALGLYTQGLQGSQGMTQLGYGASNELANTLGNNLMNQANMSYAGTANQNQANADQYSRLMNMYGTAGGAATGAYNTFF